MENTEKELNLYNLTINDSAYLIKGLDDIPRGSKLVYKGNTYDIDKKRTLRNIHDVFEGFKVFV